MVPTKNTSVMHGQTRRRLKRSDDELLSRKTGVSGRSGGSLYDCTSHAANIVYKISMYLRCIGCMQRDTCTRASRSAAPFFSHPRVLARSIKLYATMKRRGRARREKKAITKIGSQFAEGDSISFPTLEIHRSIRVTDILGGSQLSKCIRNILQTNRNKL